MPAIKPSTHMHDLASPPELYMIIDSDKKYSFAHTKKMDVDVKWESLLVRSPFHAWHVIGATGSCTAG